MMVPCGSGHLQFGFQQNTQELCRASDDTLKDSMTEVKKEEPGKIVPRLDWKLNEAELAA